MTPAPTSPAAVPKYLDVCRQVEAQIDAGELKPGDRLPSFVRMQEQYGATTATVERVMRTLEKKGLVRREPSRGIFVTARAAAPAHGIIGVLTQSAFRRHPYYAAILNGAQEEARGLGVELLLLLENAVLSRDKVDGVLVLGAHANPLKQIPLEMPAVSLMGALPGMSAVTVDDAQGTALAMEHLFALGHRRIGFLTVGHMRYADVASRTRFEAYRAALKRQRIKADPRWVRSLFDDDEAVCAFAVAARDKMQRWLEEDWDRLGCTALLTQNDEVALQASLVLQERGYRVPQQVSIVGFDNSPVSDWMKPGLTTVDVGLEAVGAAGVRLLLERITKNASTVSPGNSPEVRTLPTRLIERESTGTAPQ